MYHIGLHVPYCSLFHRLSKLSTHHHRSEKQGIIIELLVPADENLAQANFVGGGDWSMKIWSRKDKLQDGSWNISL